MNVYVSSDLVLGRASLTLFKEIGLSMFFVNDSPNLSQTTRHRPRSFLLSYIKASSLKSKTAAQTVNTAERISKASE